MKNKQSETLYCFSPPVMIVTFLIEIGLAAYSAWRFRLTKLNRLAILTLVLLATFQLAEFNICQGTFPGPDWARLGFVVITLLPPLGLHMVTAITGRKRTNILLLSYVLAGLFVTFFAFFPNSVFHELCGGNYIIFRLDLLAGRLYGLYYYGLLILSIGLAAYEYRLPKTKALTKQTLRWHILGMLVFMVPTAIVNTIDPSTIAGIPSILCGFAVLYALILALVIIPANSRKSPRLS